MKEPIGPESPAAAFNKQLVNFCQLAIHNGEQLGLNIAGIRIVAAFDTCDGTGDSGMTTAGAGNFHAQMGAVDEWLRAKKSYEHGWEAEVGRMDQAARHAPPPEDNHGEGWKHD